MSDQIGSILKIEPILQKPMLTQLLTNLLHYATFQTCNETIATAGSNTLVPCSSRLSDVIIVALGDVDKGGVLWHPGRTLINVAQCVSPPLSAARPRALGCTQVRDMKTQTNLGQISIPVVGKTLTHCSYPENPNSAMLEVAKPLDIVPNSHCSVEAVELPYSAPSQPGQQNARETLTGQHAHNAAPLGGGDERGFPLRPVATFISTAERVLGASFATDPLNRESKAMGHTNPTMPPAAEMAVVADGNPVTPAGRGVHMGEGATLAAAYIQFIQHKQAAGVRPATLAAYNGRVTLFRHWLRDQNVTHLNQLTYELMDEWVLSMRQQQVQYDDPRSSRPAVAERLSDHTVAGRIRSVKTFVAFCHQRGLITHNVAAQLKQGRLNHSSKTRQIRRADMYKMFDAATARWREHGHPRDLALLLFAADTGARRGELASLQISHLDLEECEATVWGKTGERVVDFTPETAAILRRWLDYRAAIVPDGETAVWVATSRRAVIATPLGSSGIYQIFERIGREAEVNGRCNPQAWRHHLGNTLTQRRESLRTVQEKLGHGSIFTTATYYQEPQREHIKAATRNSAPTVGYALEIGETAV